MQQQLSLLEHHQRFYAAHLQPGVTKSPEKALSKPNSAQSSADCSATPLQSQNLPQQQHPPCLADAGTPLAVSCHTCSTMSSTLPNTARRTLGTSSTNLRNDEAASDTSSTTARTEHVTAQSTAKEQRQNTTTSSDFEISDHQTPQKQQQHQQQPAQWPLAAAAVAADISNWLVGGMTGMTSRSSPSNTRHSKS
jgi:hypothetical protein